MLIDTHAHVNFNAFKEDADEVIKKSLEGGVQMINVGSQHSTNKRAIKFAEKYKKGVWAAIGFHPIHINREQRGKTIEYQNSNDFNFDEYLFLARHDKVVAIGEVGLDYHHFEVGDNTRELKAKQTEIFEQSIRLANAAKLPMIIHCWDAYDDLFDILRDNGPENKGVIHSFIGSYKTAKKFTDLGFKIGLNGIVTYSESYDKLIGELPLEDILLETDCPYLPPKPLPRNGRNEPINTKYVAEKVAEVRGIDISEVEKITTQTASKLFGV